RPRRADRSSSPPSVHGTRSSGAGVPAGSTSARPPLEKTHSAIAPSRRSHGQIDRTPRRLALDIAPRRTGQTPASYVIARAPASAFVVLGRVVGARGRCHPDAMTVRARALRWVAAHLLVVGL